MRFAQNRQHSPAPWLGSSPLRGSIRTRLRRDISLTQSAQSAAEIWLRLPSVVLCYSSVSDARFGLWRRRTFGLAYAVVLVQTRTHDRRTREFPKETLGTRAKRATTDSDFQFRGANPGVAGYQ